MHSGALMSAYPRIPALDGVRALAVLGVLAAHTGIPGVTGGFSLRAPGGSALSR